MGVSTDGILAFGVALELEQEPFPWPGVDPESEEAEEMDLGMWLGKQAGLPDTDFAKMRELEAQCPIESVTHCSHEYPMFIVALRGYYKSASRGHVVEVAPGFLNINAPAHIRAREWCEENGFPAFDDPKWLLCSMWS
jgi:hypothetical protein